MPIGPGLAAVLRLWLADKPTGRPVFTLSPSDKTDDMLLADLERASIDFEDAEERCFDFHSLRGQYITELGRSGAPQVVVQKLGRHVSFNTTRRYLDITLADEAAAGNRLPDLGPKP